MFNFLGEYEIRNSFIPSVMWGDSESAMSEQKLKICTSINVSRKFSELVYKTFLKIWASDFVKAVPTTVAHVDALF